MRLRREQEIDRTTKRHKFTLTDKRVTRLNSKEIVKVKDPRLELRTENHKFEIESMRVKPKYAITSLRMRESLGLTD